MRLCDNCHQFVSDNSLFCANCGAAQDKTNSKPSSAALEAPATPAYPSTIPPSYPNTINSPSVFQQQDSVKRVVRNRGVAAALNFFIPGVGYIYNGVGRDKTQLIFGVIVFIAVFIGFYVPFIGSFFVPVPASATPLPAVQLLEIFLFILPFGLAYDAYQRAR